MPRRASNLDKKSRVDVTPNLDREESRSINRRRVALVCQSHESGLTATESDELDRLTAAYSARVEAEVPRSLEFLDRLDDRLAEMRKALLARKSRRD